MDKLPLALERKLIRLGTRLIDQKRGRRLVEPTEDRDGFWFGGGNSVRDPNDGSLWLIGRYRDAGDSRTGLTAGPRGRALAIFRSTDNGRSFAEVRTWDKSDLYCGSAVLSIEGSALRLNKRRVQVLVSTEKVRLYPRPVAAFSEAGYGRLEHRRLHRYLHRPARPTGVDCPSADQRRSGLSAPQRPQSLDRNGPAVPVALLHPSVHLVCEHFGSRRARGSFVREPRPRLLFPRPDLGCGCLAHHLPPARAQGGRVRLFALALALFLRWSRVHAPAQSACKGSRPTARLLLRGIGRLGVWLRSPIPVPSPPQLPPAALRLAGRHGLLALRVRADRSGRGAFRHLAALDPNPLAAAFRPPAHASAGGVPALLKFRGCPVLPAAKKPSPLSTAGQSRGAYRILCTASPTRGKQADLWRRGLGQWG